jgi:hypothetical protein
MLNSKEDSYEGSNTDLKLRLGLNCHTATVWKLSA